MSQEKDTTIALFIDFDNVALGARDARQRFDIKLLMLRVLEKGKILVKKAYADWHYYKEHMSPLHEAAIELIEIPMPRISGKNSADIKLVVDAMELCYTKDHIDTFVIVSGDSDFSPLVSKLRENNKRVIGVGVKNSSSHLLINNCDEFIFYDNIYRDAMGQSSRSVGNVPADKREMFEFLVGTVQGLLQESRGGVLYSSLIKDTMTRKMPDFNERSYGYSTFGDLLEDARRLGLLVVERDARAGGTWVVQGMGEGKPLEEEEPKPARSSSRRRRRSSGRGRTSGEAGSSEDQAAENGNGAASQPTQQDKPDDRSPKTDATKEAAQDQTAQPSRRSGSRTRSRSQRGRSDSSAETKNDSQEKVTTGRSPARKTTTKKAPTRKTTTRRAPDTQDEAKKVTKKAVTKKAVAKKAVTKKAPARKAVSKKAPTTKAVTKKAPAKKAVTKKTATKKAATKKVSTKKATTKKAGTKKAGARKKAGS